MLCCDTVWQVRNPQCGNNQQEINGEDSERKGGLILYRLNNMKKWKSSNQMLIVLDGNWSFGWKM
jgi:hypothetical protein